MTVEDVKVAIAAQIQAAVPELNEVLPNEPKQFGDLPWVTMMSAGFQRAPLETAVVASNIVDPLGGKNWLWKISVRLWVSLKTDELAAQVQADQLTTAVVDAIDADRSLSGAVTEVAIISGTVETLTTTRGQPLLLTTMDLQVEWTEDVS